MKKIFMTTMIVIMLLSLVACSTHIHKVGNGAQGNSIQTARQWYAVFGLVPLNNVDTNAMASGATNYEIKTEQTFIDGLITVFTSYVTVSCRTVEVKK